MSNFSRFWYGFPFLLKSTGLISNVPTKTEEFYWDSKLFPNKKYRVKYFLTNKKSKESPPTIFLTHGMSGYGIDDIRMTDVANSLSASGYNVVVPEFEEIKALKITHESVKNIKDVFLALLERPELNTKQIGFFSISFSAGFGLTAFTDPEIANLVKVIIAIGGFGNLLDTCSYAMENYLEDDYPTNILFYNYLHLLYEDTQSLSQVFYEAALDNGFSRKEYEKVAPKLYEKLSKGHKEIFDRVKLDKDFRHQFVDTIKASYGESARLASPFYWIEKIKSPVCLLHGKDDGVISENESIKLAEKMKVHGLEYHLELTGLLSHGDKIPVWKQISSIPGLASAFGYFFEKLNEKD